MSGISLTRSPTLTNMRATFRGNPRLPDFAVVTVKCASSGDPISTLFPSTIRSRHMRKIMCDRFWQAGISWIFVIVVVCATAIVGHSQTQITTGTIEGTVTDEQRSEEHTSELQSR